MNEYDTYVRVIRDFLLSRRQSVNLTERGEFMMLAFFLLSQSGLVTNFIGEGSFAPTNPMGVPILLIMLVVAVAAGLYHAYPPLSLRRAVAACVSMPDASACNHLGALLDYCNSNYVPAIRPIVRAALATAVTKASNEVLENAGPETRKVLKATLRQPLLDVGLALAVIQSASTILDDQAVQYIQKIATSPRPQYHSNGLHAAGVAFLKAHGAPSERKDAFRGN
jgi:hypothetical protein